MASWSKGQGNADMFSLLVLISGIWKEHKQGKVSQTHLMYKELHLPQEAVKSAEVYFPECSSTQEYEL